MPLNAPSTIPTTPGVTYRPNDPAELLAKRKRLKLKQVWVAQVAGVSHGMVHNVERGKTGASEPVARGIAEALGSTLESLFHECSGGSCPHND